MYILKKNKDMNILKFIMKLFGFGTQVVNTNETIEGPKKIVSKKTPCHRKSKTKQTPTPNESKNPKPNRKKPKPNQ